MPRPPYPKSRRIFMQAALCGVFAVSVGLAAMATRYRKAIPLAGSAEFSHIRLELPANWTLEHQGKGAVLFIQREDPTPERDGRTLTGIHKQLPAQVSARDFLNVSGLLDGTRPITVPGHGVDGEPIKMSGMQGVLMAVQPPITSGVQTRWIACCVRPDGLAIALLLDCPENTDPSEDRETITKVAATVQEMGN